MDTGNTVATFGQRMPAKLFSQAESDINHFNDNPMLRCASKILFNLIYHNVNSSFLFLSFGV